MVEFKVRLADINDVDRVALLFDLYRQFYGQTANFRAVRHFLYERINANQSTVLLAETLKKDTIGFAQLFSGFSSIQMAPVCMLNDLYVLEAFRKSGVASLLIKAAHKHAAAAGAVSMTIQTRIGNKPAQWGGPRELDRNWANLRESPAG